MGDEQLAGGVHVGWPDEHERRTVRERYAPKRVLGYVRSAGAGCGCCVRYFPEDCDGLPLAGTFRTRKAAVAAVVSSWAEGRGAKGRCV